MPARGLDPRIKLRHLTCFWEVARLKSVVAAAEALNVTQPAISKSLKELETYLGGALFDRLGRRLVLTALGETFFRYTSTALAALRQGLEAARGGQEEAVLRIGALPTVSAGILPKAVLQFGKDHPHLKTRVVTGPNDYLMGLLRTGEVDLIIGRMAQADQMLGLTFEHLYFERVVMAVRPDHPLRFKTPFEMADIQPFPILMPTPHSVIRQKVDQMLLAQGAVDLHIPVETVSNTFGRSYIRQSDAIWMISEGVIAQDLLEGQLALLPADMGDTLGSVGFTARAALPPSLGLSLFMQAVRGVAMLRQ